MATPSTLQTLIELATKETDEAARLLGMALRLCEEADQKLDLLTQYRHDYAQRCQTSLESGISTTHFNNFQVFMHKLDQAIIGQEKVVSDVKQRALRARTAWLACEQKKMSFATLVERAGKASARREVSRDQRQNDEFAARSAQRKNYPS